MEESARAEVLALAIPASVSTVIREINVKSHVSKKKAPSGIEKFLHIYMFLMFSFSKFCI